MSRQPSSTGPPPHPRPRAPPSRRSTFSRTTTTKWIKPPSRKREMPLDAGWGPPPSLSREVQRLLPPTNFIPAGVLEWVRHSTVSPPFIFKGRRATGRRRSGEVYERKVQAWLEGEFEGRYVPSPWFYFKAVGQEKVRWCQPDGLLFDPHSGLLTIVEVKLQHTAAAWWQVKLLYFKAVGQEKVRWCQPDGLLFDPHSGLLTIVEVKLQHTAAAWWQVKLLYFPIIAQVFPPDLWRYSFVEVVKWYDRDTAFPERIQLLPHIALAEEGRFGVHIVKP